MADLFGAPANWRAPSKGEQTCQVCKAAASCGTGGGWFCAPHAPADFWPEESRARRGFVQPEVEDVL